MYYAAGNDVCYRTLVFNVEFHSPLACLDTPL